MNRSTTSWQRYCRFLQQYRQRRLDEGPGDAMNGTKPDTPRPKLNQRRLRDYVRWLSPFRGAFAVLFLLSLLAACLQMLQPLFSRYIIDQVLLKPKLSGAAQISRLHLAGSLFLGVVILSTAIGAVKIYQQRLLNARMVLKLSRALCMRLLNLPLDKLREMKTGGILSRLSGDVVETSGLSHIIILSPLVSSISLLVAVGILAWLNWRLSLIALAVVASIILVSLVRARRVRPIFRALRNQEARIGGRMGEVFSGIRVVRAYRRERHEFLDFTRGRNTVTRMELFAERQSLVIWVCWTVFIGCTSVATAWYGAYLNLLGKISVGDIMAFQWYTFLLLTPAWDIVSSFSELQRSLASMDRIFEVLAMSTDKPDRPGARDAPTVVREICFENVEFAYPNGRTVIRNFSVSVLGGSVVALVGRSGSGKTTVMDLVARFYDPTKGRVLLNGCDIRDLRLRSHRSLLATVQQETFLFDGSVRDNIKYGNSDASDAKMMDAALRANAHEFIANLPEQYDTNIGERGVRLSGGQQQRLAIARAIVASPQILILDEATSNLDTESEHLIQASMAELLAGRTTFVIAHRLSTVRRADLILVMEDGCIIERGTHNELMRARGTYYDMVVRQLASHESSAETYFDEGVKTVVKEDALQLERSRQRLELLGLASPHTESGT
jgi:ATP-binding cassette, subfamily B, bacterial